MLLFGRRGLNVRCGWHCSQQQSQLPPKGRKRVRRPKRSKTCFPCRQSYSPYAGRNFPTRVFFGDTHVHTGASMDAGAFGARLGPEEAYRFARGEEMTAANGMKVRLSRPLDFIVVADHSDNFGFFPKLFSGDPSYLADATGKRWYDMIQKGGQEAVEVATEVIDTFSKGTFPPALASLPGTEIYRSAWEKDIQAAEATNEPGRFTSFIGYEWTSNTGGNNLHRVVVFRDGARKGRTGRALHDDPAGGERRSEGPVEGPPGLRGQDRRQRPRDRAQR